MKSNFFLVILFFHLVFIGNAQQFKQTSMIGREIIDVIPENHHEIRSISPAEQEEMIRLWKENSRKTLFSNQAKKSGAVFEMIFDDAVPERVKSVFIKAGEIWGQYLESEVPIRVQVNWKPLGANILGSASSYRYYANFSGAPFVNTYYPVAMAEKISHRNLNGNEPDMIANFNSSYSNWYVGTDGTPKLPSSPSRSDGEIDLYSVVLHEFGHGLGFIGNLGVNDAKTLAGYSIPGTYDRLIQDRSGLNLTDTTTKYKNPSAELLTALTTPSGLFLSSPKIVANNGNRGILYSPRTYDAGSSIYHLNSGTYPAGNPDALMVPFVAQGEITRDIGPITQSGFYDMGWYGSSIIAKEERDFEDINADFISYANIYSDTVLAENSLRFFYAIDNNSIVNAREVIPERLADGRYKVSIPGLGREYTIKYYWQMREASGKIIASPSEAPLIPKTPYANYYETKVGIDQISPTAQHRNSIKYIFDSQREISLPLVYASDNIGINSVELEYQINNGETQKVKASVLNTDSTIYSVKLNFSEGQLANEDVINYKFLIKDKANNTNEIYLPSTGTYDIRVAGFLSERYQYFTNFDVNDASKEFFLKGFQITKPDYFNSKGLHSEHPYQDGSEEDYDGNGDYFTNNDAILLHPIVLLSDTSKMYLYQACLVENGEDGASFYNADGTINRSFFDYVIVQASNDYGLSWKDIREGWDSSLETNWNSSYSRNFDENGNSTTYGTQGLYRRMTININEKKHFKPGDKLVFRFRLHADVGAHAWGWAIDSLIIQAPANQDFKQAILANQEPEVKSFKAYPNPAINTINTLFYSEKLQKISYSLRDFQGRILIKQEQVLIPGINFKTINIENIPSGVYFIEAITEDKKEYQKIIVEK